MRYYEVSGSWSMLVAVDTPETEGSDPDAEQAAMAYFSDEFPMKEFFRGLDVEEHNDYDHDEYDITIKPASRGSYEWVGE